MSKTFSPTIGKNVIETLTMGMYEDPRFIFREYIQNSADAIDSAVKLKIFKSPDEGNIFVTIDPKRRKIVIEDNATGIESKKAQYQLTDVANSTKDKNIYKGFRGIGRLGGLGYCNKLTFETSFAGEKVKSKVVFDAKRLRQIIDNAKAKVSAAELVSVITEFSKELEEEITHYFKVTMETVTNDDLLDIHKITNYMSMVAPLPYSDQFQFKNEIHTLAKAADVKIDIYNVSINGHPVYKGYKNKIYKKTKVVDEIIAIQQFEERIEKELLYWGWFGVTNKMNQITDDNLERGIRLRKGNIQIGLENRLDPFHKNPNGNKYFVGEIFAVHKGLIPNARRDFFIDGIIESTFSRQLKDFFHSELYPLYYAFSEKNAALRTMESFRGLETKLEKAKSMGDSDEQQRLTEKIEELNEVVYKASADLIRLHKEYKETPLGQIIEEKQNISTLKRIQQRVGSRIESSEDETTEADAFGQLSFDERKLLTFIFKVVRRNFTKQQASAFVKKIKKELSDFK